MVLGSRVMKQVAFVVPDPVAAVASYVELLGMDAPEIRTPPPREGREYRGEPLPEAINFKVAMFELDNITLELSEPLGGLIAWHDVLAEQGGAALHHPAVEGVLDHRSRAREIPAPAEKSLQPSPTIETRRPESPRLRYSIAGAPPPPSGAAPRRWPRDGRRGRRSRP